jgi:hypothetical protein
MFDIADKPGKMPKETMRGFFERMVNDTPAFKASTPLGAIEVNGKFSHYMNPDTDTMWLGFALGMRCAQRISNVMPTEPQRPDQE